ncbi:hypothetical protein K504DRAFT_496737 [Pleomassaria siparia CBS 279.74]|uniref:Uncharacterized protein n=1 Tax=Pleomassaria siparia CBS 279.74 TaxID=1314801 RepID=A0A6G1KPL0_9PLEO|nr:hypothetical protein K504DRAFT_496737 [Pleomassaria siparia CBS 279.74]
MSLGTFKMDAYTVYPHWPLAMQWAISISISISVSISDRNISAHTWFRLGPAPLLGVKSARLSHRRLSDVIDNHFASPSPFTPSTPLFLISSPSGLDSEPNNGWCSTGSGTHLPFFMHQKAPAHLHPEMLDKRHQWTVVYQTIHHSGKILQTLSTRMECPRTRSQDCFRPSETNPYPSAVSINVETHRSLRPAAQPSFQAQNSPRATPVLCTLADDWNFFVTADGLMNHRQLNPFGLPVEPMMISSSTIDAAAKKIRPLLAQHSQ